MLTPATRDERPASRRASLLAAAVLGAVVLLFWSGAFTGGTFWHRDLLLYTYPIKAYVRARWLHGELALWAPDWGTGRPLFGLIQPGVLDPMNVWTLLPLPLGLDLYSVAYALVLAFGTRRWLRVRGATDVEASLGALWMTLGGYAIGVLSTLGTYGWGVAWVPWALATWESHSALPGRHAFARGTASTAFFLAWALLAGDPMAPFFAGLFALALTAGERDATVRRRRLAMLAAAAALCGVVCAMQLLPAVELAAVSRREGVSFERASHWTLPLQRLVELCLVDPFGTPHTPTWVVTGLYRHRGGPARDPLASSLYQGLALLPLVAFALRTRARATLALGALTLLGALIALGRQTPVWSAWYHLVPPARFFRYPEKYWFLVSLGLAALATAGLAEARRDPPATRRAATALGLTALLTLAVTARWPEALVTGLVGALPSLRLDEAAQGLVHAGLRMAVVGGLYALLVRRATAPDGSPEGVVRWAPRATAALVALLALDPFVAGLTQRTWARATIHTDPSPMARVMAARNGGTLRGVRVHRSLRLRLRPDFLGADDIAASLPPNLGMAQGLAYVAPYDVIAVPEVVPVVRALDERPFEGARLAGARFVVTPLNTPLPPDAHPLGAMNHLGLLLVELEHTTPRAWLARRVTPVESAEAAVTQMLAPGRVWGEDAAIVGARAVTGATGACRLTVDAPERVVLRCESDGPSWAVLLDTHFPGWTATVNGVPVAIHAANGSFRAVPVPAGRSRVEMRYEPRGLRRGAWVSLLGLLAVAALARWGRRDAHTD